MFCHFPSWVDGLVAEKIYGHVNLYHISASKKVPEDKISKIQNPNHHFHSFFPLSKRAQNFPPKCQCSLSSKTGKGCFTYQQRKRELKAKWIRKHGASFGGVLCTLSRNQIWHKYFY